MISTAHGQPVAIGIDTAVKLSKNQKKKLFNKQYPNGKNVKQFFNDIDKKPASPKLSDLPKMNVNISNLAKAEKQPAQQIKKREKIFVDVYSSYL